MNKRLVELVNAKCKDMGHGEKHLQELTEALGGHIADDSTDEAEITRVADLIAKVAKSSQGEATRRFQKNEDTRKKEEEEKAKQAQQQQQQQQQGGGDGDMPAWFKKYSEEQEKRFAEFEAKQKEADERTKREARNKTIQDAMTKHRIPENVRAFINVPEDEQDIDGYVAKLEKAFVTNGLPGAEDGQTKATIDKQAEVTGRNWFSRLSGKDASKKEEN